MPHVLVLRPLHPDAIAALREGGATFEMLTEVNDVTLAEALPRAEALIVRATPITHAVVAQAPKLRICARHGVGYDQVDVAALTERGIPLTVTPEANAGAVAEHALMLMLAAARQLRAYDARTRALQWGPTPTLPSFDLAGRSVLVVGFGRIGTRVARLCAAFGMRVLVRDPFVPVNTIRGLGHTPAKDLAAALGEADVVTLHCPANPETRGMVDDSFLAATKPGAVLINTARGTLVQEAALEASLRSGHLAAAGLDVFWEEPVSKPIGLLSLPNVLLTPHSAAATEQATRRMGLSCVESILACFAGTLDEEVVINRAVLPRRNA